MWFLRQHEQVFLNLPPSIYVRTHSASALKDDGGTRVESAHRRMMRIADDDRDAASPCLLCGRREAFLVGPGKVLFVVSNETVPIMGDCVGRIAVDYVPVIGAFQLLFEVALLDGCAPQHSRSANESIGVAEELSIAASPSVWDIEQSGPVQAVDPAEGGPVEIQKPCGPLDWRIWVSSSHPIVVSLGNTKSLKLETDSVRRMAQRAVRSD